MSTLKRRIIRAGGWGVAKRLIKPIPIVGSVFAFGLAGYEIKKKGLIPGAVHVGLDVTPFIGTAKAFQEAFPTVSLRLYVEALGAVSQLVLDGRAAIGVSGPLAAEVKGI